MDDAKVYNLKLGPSQQFKVVIKYQMTNNDLYQQLRQQGLVLAQGVEIHLPPIQPPKPTLLSSLASYLIPEQPPTPELNPTIHLIPILNNCFIVGRANTLIYYKYTFAPGSHQLSITRPFLTHLNFKIDRIHVCDAKYLSDRGEIAFAVQTGNTLTLFSVDLKGNRIIEGGSVDFHKIQSVRFICEKELIVMSSNGLKYHLHHCFISSGKIKERSKILFEFDREMENKEIIKKIDISANIDEQQESTVCVFYLSVMKQDDKERKKRMEQQMFATYENSQVFRVKEFERDLNGNLTTKNTFKVFSTKDRNLLPQHYDISIFNKFYCIAGSQEVIVVKKKFDRYLVIDNVVQKVGGNTLKLHQKGIVTTQNSLSMELNMVQFADPKCINRMLDSIEVPAELAQGFVMLWPYKVDKDSSLIFVFRKQKKLVFCNLIKMNPIEKMLFVVENAPKDKIPMIQEIAVNLGISKKDFYVSQWQHSKRELAEIHQFLLPCGDISTIKKQLRSTLRKKKLEVSKFLQILQKLSKIIKSQLQENLSQHLLKQYIKNDFLRRKIKLKHADWRMDYRELDRIYNGSLVEMFVEIVKSNLYPEQQEKDPLHIMVEAAVKQKLQLKHVFQVFRIPILQNYINFLINFVSFFDPSQIVNVFDNYSELLPIYEFNPDLVIIVPEYETQNELKQKLKQTLKQKPNIQEQQFSNITSVEFWREMTKQRLEKQLHDFYPTSKINEAINTLCKSDFGKYSMLHKHSLITCTMQEYKEKLKDISGIRLYLKLCERVNEENLHSRDQKADLSRQLIEIFKRKNNLTGKAYETVRLYSALHRFMLQNNFFQKKRITTDQLALLRDQDLVALFFLQNKQRKQFIFEEFRNIYLSLYPTPEQFNAVINKFIESQNCSRIELEIFIHEIKAKSKQFQDENQDLIEVIIDGFCKKLELREENDTQRFVEIMLEMPLVKRLNLKIRKMLSIRECLEVFVLFKCEKESYYRILKMQEGNEIFKLLLERYFCGQMLANTITIDQDVVSLEYCRNMLTVLFYLQQYVYYEVTQQSLLLTYCQVLVQWKQYEVIMGVVHQQCIPEQFGIEVTPFVDRLVRTCLHKMYTDEEVVFSEETKEHIRHILELYGPVYNQTKRRQLAKLELAEIFEQWGTNVHTHDIHLVVTEWEENKRQVFIKDLINSYIDNLTFETFVNLYEHLKMAAREVVRSEVAMEHDLELDQSERDQQFINYAVYFAQRLLLEKRYHEISKIIAFIKSTPSTCISYALISQTFLQCLISKHPSPESLECGKQVIQYFTQYFENDCQVQRIFESQLQAAQFQYMAGDKEQKIVVDALFCFKKEYVEIEVEILWKVAFGLYEEKGQGNVAMLYYAYYFLLMMYRSPEHGFKVSRISYPLETLTDLIFKLESKIDQTAELWHINIYSLFKKFLRSLYLEGLTRIKDINPELFHAQFTQRADESHLEMIRTRLKEDRETNHELLRCISRVEQYIVQYKAVRKLEKQAKLERSILEEEKQKELKERQERIKTELLRLQQQRLQNQTQDEQKITVSLKRFNYLRKNISFQSSISHLVTEKEIAEQIYALEKEEKKKSERNLPAEKGNFLKKLNEHEKLPKLHLKHSSSIEGNLMPGQVGQSMNFLDALRQGLQDKFNPMGFNSNQQQLQPGMQQMMYFQSNPQQPMNPFNMIPQSQSLNPYPVSQYPPTSFPAYQDPLELRIQSIFTCINNEKFANLHSLYRRQELTMAAERIFHSSQTSFSDCVIIMSKMGIIDERKLSVCLASNMYLESNEFFVLTNDELKRIYPFGFLITPSTHFMYEFTQRMFMVMMEAVGVMAETKETVFLMDFAHYIGHVLGDQAYSGHFLVEILVSLLRSNIQPETLSRISFILNSLTEYPHQVKYHMQLIQQAFSSNLEKNSRLEEYHQKFISILQDLDRTGSHKRMFSGESGQDEEFMEPMVGGGLMNDI